MLSPWELKLAAPAHCQGATLPVAAEPSLSQNSPRKQMSYDQGSDREGNQPKE